LYDRTFAADRAARADAKTAGQDFYQCYVRADDSVVSGDRGDDLRHAVPLSFGGKPPGEPRDEQQAERWDGHQR